MSTLLKKKRSQGARNTNSQVIKPHKPTLFWDLSTLVKIDAMSSLILVVTSLPASPVLLQVFPVVVRTASFQCVPLMGGPIPVPVWLAVWDSRTISLSLACVVSVTPVPANPARGTRGMISCVVNGCQLMNTKEKLGTTLSCLLSLPQWLTARLLFQVAVSVVSRLRGPYQYGVCYSISFTDHQQPPHPPISFDPSLMV